MLNDLWAAILDFPLPVTSGSIHNTVIELLDPENVGIAVGAALLSSLEAEIKNTSGLWAAILNFRLLDTSSSIPNRAIGFLDPETVGSPLEWHCYL